MPSPAWPADPASAWAESRSAPRTIARTRPVPRLDTAEDVGAHLQSAVLSTWGPPIVVLVLDLGFIWLLATHPNDVPEFFAARANPAVLWSVAVLGLVVAPVLWWLLRLGAGVQLAHECEQVMRAGVLCDVFASPLSWSSGDGETDTRILIDATVPDDRAARILAALTLCASRPGAEHAFGPEPGWTLYIAVTSAELFGDEAAGGYLVRDLSASPGEWALLIPEEEPEYPGHPFGRCRTARVTDPPLSAWDRM
ncbi:hypothetical protein [Streptomyces sp. NPDC056061]|uniref:hypothetical protein n=1 Tax=Streptomyces sp. NPDC056061 TaxID=3345700 RepID=UPI0035DBBDDB